MAETIGTVPAATRKQSVARIEFFTEAHKQNDDWNLVVHFENALYDAQGALIPGSQVFGSRSVSKRIGDIKNVSITAGGVTATVAQLVALIEAAGYALRRQAVLLEGRNPRGSDNQSIAGEDRSPGDGGGSPEGDAGAGASEEQPRRSRATR